MLVDGDVLGEEPLWHTGRIGNLAMLILAIWGYASAERRTQSFIAGSILLIFIGLIALRFWNPR